MKCVFNLRHCWCCRESTPPPPPQEYLAYSSMLVKHLGKGGRTHPLPRHTRPPNGQTVVVVVMTDCQVQLC